MIDDTNFLEYGQEMIVIREIFDGAHELFENELERALEFGCPTIVIEPCRLGEETARWIFFGEYLTRYSIVTGLGSIVTGLLWPERIFIQYSLLGSAILAHGIYLVSWKQDICSNYRVARNPEQFLKSMAAQRPIDTIFSGDDNVSLVTSTNEYSLDEETEDIDDEAEKGRESKLEYLSKLSGHQSYRPTNPYEMILSTSTRKQKPPVVLCRRTNNEVKRSNLINAAVSLLAIAFSFIRFVRSSFVHSSSSSSISNRMMIQSKWLFLKHFTTLI